MSVLLLDPLSIEESGLVQQLSAGVLQGLPQVDQNNEPTSDHAADENARMNCVFTSNAAVSRKIGGHPEANGDAIKDGCAHYGQGYTGGADETVVASDGCLDSKWGIHADTVHTARRSDLITVLKSAADAGHFSLVSIPSQWNSQPTQSGYNPDTPNFWTHVCVYCGYFGDTHVLMNPWGGFLMYYSTADLQLRLCYLKVYPIHPVAAAPTPPVPPTKGTTNDMLDFHYDGQHIISATDHDNPHLSLGDGLANAVHDRNLGSQSILMGERKVGGVTVALLHNATSPTVLLTWTDQNQAGVFNAPDAAQAMYSALQELDACKSQPVPAPVDNSAALTAAHAALGDANKALSALDTALTEVK